MDNLNADFSIENNQPLEAQFTLNPNNFACSFEVYAAGTVWGSIAGDINNQIDLKNALDLKADKSELDLAVSELNVNIQNEATTRAESDTLLQNNINTLSQTVTANYNALDGKIDTEIASRTLADTTLQNNIDAEALARQNADTTLQGNIYTLSQTVTDNNTAINNRVDGVVSAFDDEIENINNNISDLSDTVSDNYTDLDDKISDNAGDIVDINNTINTYGDIVTYNAADFATSTQGALADSALQSGDNISELVNNVGYITSASLPTDYVPNTRTINGYALTSNITLNYSDVGALSSSTTINDLTTTAQQNALNSGATATNIGQITTNANDISNIQDLIPNQASSSNQLADKDFVNSSIATNTANFIGTFNSVAELEAYSGTLTNNDYAFVATTDSAGNTLYDRYKYNADTQEWLFEYELNNSSFTAQQWASINSGATTTNIGQIATNASDISDLQTNKQDVLTAGANIQINNNVISATDTTYTAGTGISIVNGVISNTQTSAEWGNITGVLSSQTDLQNALDAKYDASNPDNFISDITDSMVITALGYTPYNSTNPNNYITASALTGYATENYVDTGLATKQATLVSGTNIKTINNISLLGTGDISVLENTATQSTSVAILTSSSNVKNNTVAVGYNASVNGYMGIAIGSQASVTKTSGIQIGYGTNNEANSLYVATSTSNNWKMLDSNGLIPDARLSSNIARTSNTLPSSTKYGADLSYSSNTLQLLDQDGNNLGNSVTIQSSPDIDGVTITTNSDSELQTVGVIDSRSGSAIKTWTGTKAQYDAIVTKDATTLYNITDDTDTTLTLLELLYPVGSIYIGTMATCPLATLGVGTWQLVAVDRVLQGATDGSVVGNTVQAGLPNITGTVDWSNGGQGHTELGTASGAFAKVASTSSVYPSSGGTSTAARGFTFDASRSSSVYGNSNTVQPPAYLVNIWERIS